MDSKRELVIPNSEPYIPHENEDPQLIEPNSGNITEKTFYLYFIL